MKKQLLVLAALVAGLSMVPAQARWFNGKKDKGIALVKQKMDQIKKTSKNIQKSMNVDKLKQYKEQVQAALNRVKETKIDPAIKQGTEAAAQAKQQLAELKEQAEELSEEAIDQAQEKIKEALPPYNSR